MRSTTMRIVTYAVLTITFCLVAPQTWGREVVLFEEDFEGVTLEASIMEQIKDKDVWSGTPPEGWEITNENPKDLGMPEWRTWRLLTLSGGREQRKTSGVVSSQGYIMMARA